MTKVKFVAKAQKRKRRRKQAYAQARSAPFKGQSELAPLEGYRAEPNQKLMMDALLAMELMFIKRRKK